MTPIDWAIVPLKRFAVFDGRATRPEFWWFTLLLLLVTIITRIIDGLLFYDGPQLLSIAVLAAATVPALAVGVRRLHDTDRSGWWMLAGYGPSLIIAGRAQLAASGLLPVELEVMAGLSLLNLIVMVGMIFMLASPGTKGPNRFGEPREWQVQ